MLVIKSHVIVFTFSDIDSGGQLALLFYYDFNSMDTRIFEILCTLKYICIICTRTQSGVFQQDERQKIGRNVLDMLLSRLLLYRKTQTEIWHVITKSYINFIIKRKNITIICILYRTDDGNKVRSLFLFSLI